jgi:AraC-like DNA-binding protein
MSEESSNGNRAPLLLHGSRTDAADSRGVSAELANELLTGTDHSITDIANELGYTESQNFIRTFKRWTGQTPRQFRRGLSQ